MSAWRWERREGGLDTIVLDSWRARGVDFGFTARGGGVSQGPFASLNVSFRVGDAEADVRENRRRLMALWNREASDLAETVQVHGARVFHASGPAGAQPPEADALATDCPGVYLGLFFADCIPIAFFDPARRVVALAHAGWKGTMAGVAGAVLDAMRERYGSSASDVEAFIGPGIGPCCFAVQPELAEQARRAWPFHRETLFWDGQWRWDLKAANRLQLLEKGLAPEQVTDCALCTCCRPEAFFSYRRDNTVTGRMGLVVALT
jgi:YfiH family protein